MDRFIRCVRATRADPSARAPIEYDRHECGETDDKSETTMKATLKRYSTRVHCGDAEIVNYSASLKERHGFARRIAILLRP
jgi:hypothetical protein